MKYFVQVNRNMMVSVEAESANRAEHVFLDLDGIQYALAYDDEMRKTDCFRGALLGCDTKSLDEIAQLSGDYTKAWQAVGKAKDEWMTADSEVRRLQQMLDKAKEDSKAAERAYFGKLREAKTCSALLNIESED